MAITIKHAKTDTIADWTQADLDQQIAAGNYPPGTLLANIVLPSDWNNDHTLTGTIAIANGGTGATTATDAINALLPSQTSNTGKVLTTDGTNTSWTANGNGTVTNVSALTLGTTGTDLSSTVANSTTTPVITLNVPTASATNRGALSSADWTTFNGKAPSVTYTTNYVPYGQGTTTPNQSANLQFTGSNLLIGQTYDQGTGALQITGTSTRNGNALDKALYLQGGNNLLIQSQNTTTGWGVNGSPTITTGATAPDGTSTALQFVTSSSSQGLYQYFTTVVGTTYTASGYFKLTSGSGVFNNVNFGFGGASFNVNLTTGVIQGASGGISYGVSNVGNGWYRLSIVFTATVTSTGVSYISGQAQTYLAWGLQTEIGSVASSYTPTTTVAITTTNNISVPSGSITTSADSTFNTVKVGLGGGSVSNNTALGTQVLNATATGTQNTGIGWRALYSNTSGNNNIGIGYTSLNANTTGSDNVSVGTSALTRLISGSSNVSLGTYSQIYNVTGSSNVAIGTSTLYNNTTASNMVAIGYQSLFNNTTNVATLGTVTGGTGYTAGTYTGVVMTLSSGSTATTYPTATIVVSGGAVTSVTLTSNGVGFKDTTTVLTAPAASIGGTGSGFSVPVASLQSGTQNTAVGYQALNANTTGSQNTALGYQALLTNTTATGNTAIGYQALSLISTGAFADSTAVGALTLVSSTGGPNDAFGFGSLYKNTNGINNTGIGYNTLNNNTTGNFNVALGGNSLVSNVSSSNNTSIGRGALYTSTGGNNTALGFQAGYGNVSANANTSGTNNVYIGYQTVGSAATNTNEMVIGYQAVGLGSNTTVIGNSSTTLTKAFGVVTSTVYTVATLPSASTSGVGARAFVSDALAPTFGSTVVTGGAVAVPVYSDGTNWKVG